MSCSEITDLICFKTAVYVAFMTVHRPGLKGCC